MKLKLKRIDPASLAVVLGSVYFLFGLFVGFLGLGASVAGGNVTLNGPITYSGTGKALGFVSLLYPIVTGFLGCISGLIVAWVYNLIASFTGGISIDLRASKSDTQAEGINDSESGSEGHY